MLDEGFNPYESHADATPSIPRLSSVRNTALRVAAKPSGTITAPTTPAAIRDFDFAAAMFNDDNAWREMARAIASDAA